MVFRIMPHGRLQEWVAEEKGFFTAEGLDYTFLLNSGDYGIHSVQRDEGGEVRTGAFETFGAGRDGADVSCACHWATNAAAGERSGQLVTTAYSVAPCAIVVPPESPVRTNSVPVPLTSTSLRANRACDAKTPPVVPA